MSTDKHSLTLSIHIDAPVEKVFGYLEDPANFLASMPEKNQVTLESVNRNPDGTVSTYEAKYRQTGLHLTASYTREEYVPNERIVDHSSLGVLFIWVFEPDATGSTLTGAVDTSKLMEMLDKLFFHGAKNMEESLAKIKQAVEALP
jgi:uncharacterized protein YndB with AHSA1/START domain